MESEASSVPLVEKEQGEILASNIEDLSTTPVKSVQSSNSSSDSPSFKATKFTLNVTQATLHNRLQNINLPLVKVNENKDSNTTPPNTDNLLDLNFPKFNVLGKEQAKKRLHAFSTLKANSFAKLSKKIYNNNRNINLAKITEDVYNEAGEKIEKTVLVSKPPKSVSDPEGKAKSVIQEIEEIKKFEAHNHAFDEHVNTFRMYEKEKRKQERRKQKSHAQSDITSKGLDKVIHHICVDKPSLESKPSKNMLPSNWKEFIQSGCDYSLIREHRSRRKDHSVTDYRKQLLFETGAKPINTLTIKGDSGLDKIVPAHFIRLTKVTPSISFNENINLSTGRYLTRAQLFDYIPKSQMTIIKKTINNVTRNNNLPFKNGDTRKWYPKITLSTAECELLEPSVGLLFLKSYSDHEEDDLQKERDRNEKKRENDKNATFNWETNKEKQSGSRKIDRSPRTPKRKEIQIKNKSTDKRTREKAKSKRTETKEKKRPEKHERRDEKKSNNTKSKKSEEKEKNRYRSTSQDKKRKVIESRRTSKKHEDVNTGSTASNEKSTKKEETNKEETKKAKVKSIAEAEFGTPDTDDYHSNWESDTDIISSHKFMLSPPQIKTKSRTPPTHENKDFFSVTYPLNPKEDAKLFDESFGRSGNNLEIPLNIRHTKWKQRRDHSSDLLLSYKESRYQIFSEDSWEKEEYTSAIDLERERIRLAEERRKIATERRQLEELEKERRELEELKKERRELEELKKERRELEELKKERRELEELKKERCEIEELKKERRELEDSEKEKYELKQLEKEKSELEELETEKCKLEKLEIEKHELERNKRIIDSFALSDEEAKKQHTIRNFTGLTYSKKKSDCHVVDENSKIVDNEELLSTSLNDTFKTNPEMLESEYEKFLMAVSNDKQSSSESQSTINPPQEQNVVSNKIKLFSTSSSSTVSSSSSESTSSDDDDNSLSSFSSADGKRVTRKHKPSKKVKKNSKNQSSTPVKQEKNIQLTPDINLERNEEKISNVKHELKNKENMDSDKKEEINKIIILNKAEEISEIPLPKMSTSGNNVSTVLISEIPLPVPVPSPIAPPLVLSVTSGDDGKYKKNNVIPIRLLSEDSRKQANEIVATGNIELASLCPINDTSTTCIITKTDVTTEAVMSSEVRFSDSCENEFGSNRNFLSDDKNQSGITFIPDFNVIDKTEINIDDKLETMDVDPIEKQENDFILSEKCENTKPESYSKVEVKFAGMTIPNKKPLLSSKSAVLDDEEDDDEEDDVAKKDEKEPVEKDSRNETCEKVEKPGRTDNETKSAKRSSYKTREERSDRDSHKSKEKTRDSKRRRSRSPRGKRRDRDSSVRRHGSSLSRRRLSRSPRRRESSRRRRSLTPRRHSSPRRRDLHSPPSRRRRDSPKRRTYSPRRRGNSPRLMRRGNKSIETIQEALQRIAGIGGRNSPRKSVADSTISDEQLMLLQSGCIDKPIDSPCYSPKRLSLDERIGRELGGVKNKTETISYSNESYENIYSGYNFDVYENYTENYQMHYYNSGYGIAPNNFPQMTTPVNKVLQVGNVLQVVPNENLQQSVQMISAESDTSQKILQVGNMLQIVPTEENLEVMNENFSLQQVQQSTTSTAKINFEKLKRKQERERKRIEKHKKRMEREKRKQLKMKQLTENMIKKMGIINIEKELQKLSIEKKQALQQETQDNPDEDKQEKNTENTTHQWPPTCTKVPSKGILVSSRTNANQQGEVTVKAVKMKRVSFADGILAGEETSPSGFDELGPPPMKKYLQEKHYGKKLELRRFGNERKKKNKELNVKVLRRVSSAPTLLVDDDNMLPPPPPPGSPPSHIFPARIKPPHLNNLQPGIMAAIPQVSTPAYTVFRHQIIMPPPPLPHGLHHIGPHQHHGPPHHSGPPVVPPHLSGPPGPSHHSGPTMMLPPHYSVSSRPPHHSGPPIPHGSHHVPGPHVPPPGPVLLRPPHH